jgi:hypothetical protein
MGWKCKNWDIVRIERLRRDLGLTPEEFKRARHLPQGIGRIIRKKDGTLVLTVIISSLNGQGRLIVTEEEVEAVWEKEGIDRKERRLEFLDLYRRRVEARGWYRWEPISYSL